MTLIKPILLASAIFTALAFQAKAQDVPEPTQMYVKSGMLCDTELELQTLLTGISLSGGQYPEELPKGCGRLSVRQPLPMALTPMYWYETPIGSTLVTQFLYEPNNWLQWGWSGYTMNPDYVAPSTDPDA